MLYTVNTLFWCLLLYPIAAVRAVFPLKAWQRQCGRLSNAIAENWIWVNSLIQKVLGNTRIDVRGIETLKRSGWYLVLANHQSWVDIMVLQRIFHRKIPFLKFFIKKELFWFPVLGQAWWALDFPFIQRYRKSLLAKKPHLKGKDMEITRKACRKFRTLPVSIMNFVEGTRFTPAKHQRQKSPFAKLLKPKAGGIAFVLSAMEGRIHHVLDVTIAYGEGPRDFWAFLCGNIPEIKVNVRLLPVGPEIQGDYLNDRAFRIVFQRWLNDLWKEKDQCLEEMQHGCGHRENKRP